MQENPGASQSHPSGTSRAGCFVCNTAIPMLENLWSEATQNHFRNSRIELLKGIRSLIDDRIAHLSRDERRGAKVTVE
jgi:hypothetical protein